MPHEVFFSTGTGFVTLAEAFILVSPWKPILLLVPFVPWAWVISRVLDKHAARFFLPREGWNIAHLCVGLLAFIIAISIPMEGEAAFWVGWGIMLLILTLDIVVFALITNKDERVPEEHHLTLDFSRWTEARAQKAAAKLQGQVQLVIKGPDKSLLPAPTAGTPEFETRVAAEQLVLRTLTSRATEAVLAATGKDNTFALSLLVDGVRITDNPMPAAEAMKLMALWKAAAKMDVADMRKRQQADITVERGDAKTKIRITATGSQAGPRLTFLIDPEQQVRRKFDAMGFLEQQVVEVKAMAEESQGLVLLAGAPDSGRTTTLYAMMRLHDAYTRNVQTVEIDVQDLIEGVRQNKWDAQAEGPELSTLVRSILRREPDVVGVAEVPDAATAKELSRIEPDRVRAYGCLRAESAIQAIQLWVKLVGDPEPASKVLRGVVAQKLMRKLCSNCRVAYQPGADMLKKMGMPADKVKQLFRKGGQVLIKNKPEICPVCNGGGYFGQEAVFEVFRLGDAERAMIKAADWTALKGELRKKNLPMIQQAALRKAVDGVTSVEEIMRVTADPAQAKPAAPAAGAPKPPAAKTT